MKLNHFFRLFLFAVLISFLACEENNDNTSRVQLRLVDAEGTYEKVLINIIDVQYNRNDDDMGWVSFDGQLPEERVDLCQLISGNSLVLTDEDIDSGMLSQIRLVLGEGNALVLEGETEERPLNTPSAQQSGLKLKLNSVLEPGFSYTFTLDFDVQKSVVKAGTSGNYNLKPVIRVTAEVNSGTILGRIADVEETATAPMPISGAVITVFEDTDVDFLNPITSTLTNEEGLFAVQGLPEGTYLLRVEKTDYSVFDYPETIEVLKGKETNLSTILISKITP